MVKVKTARKMTFDVGWALLSSAFAMGVGLVLKIILGNYFDAEGLGIYSITFSLMTFIILTAGMGLHVAIIKFVAQYQEKRGILNRIVSTAMVLGAIASILATLLMFLAAPLFESLFDMPGLGYYLRIVSFCFPFVIFNNIFIGLLNGLRMMNHYAVFELLRNGLILAFTIIFIWQGFGVLGAVLALLLAPIVTAAVAMAIHRKVFTFKLRKFKTMAKKIIKFGGQLYFANVASIVNAQAATLLIGFYLTDSAVGVYAVVLMFFNFMMMFPMAVQRITYPVISFYHSKRQRGTIKELVNTILRFSFIFLSILCLLLLFFVDDMIVLVFPGKDSFLLAITPLRILALLGLMYSVIAPLSIIFTSVGRPDVTLKISMAKAVTNIGIGIALIPISITLMGFDIGMLNGAAIALGTSYVVEVILFFLLLRPFLKIRIEKRFLSIGLLFFMSVTTGAYLLSRIFDIDENYAGMVLIPLYGLSLYYSGILTEGGVKGIIRVITGRESKTRVD